MDEQCSGRVHFGGPDRPARHLRDILEQKVDAVPAGGVIDWMTYYFRDEKLADALVRAHRRGVVIRLCLEGAPRLKDANDAVIARLRSGIGKALHVVGYAGPGRLHTKLYCFSHPYRHALVGSFNPSGNVPEDPAVIAEIDDQDRGHNLLVEIAERRLVTSLTSRVAAIHAGRSPYGMLAWGLNRFATVKKYQAFFFPRIGKNPLDERLMELGNGSRLRMAVSHMTEKRTAKLLIALVKSGVDVEVLTHHTRRRAPEEVIQRLRDGGVRVIRYEHPDKLPMHSKFVLARSGARKWSAFGSYNLKARSRLFNQELLVFSTDESLWDTLDERWQEMRAEPWCKA